MSTTTLFEAHARFAAALDELRRKYVAQYDQWLKTALADERTDNQREARERIATTRKLFADEFLDQRAPAIIRSFNPNAEHSILEALRAYDAKPEVLPQRAATAPSLRWQASLWRTVLAAAFGAVVGVIILALQPVPEAPTPPPTVTQPTQPTTPTGQQLNVQGPAVPAAQAPTETTPQPQPPASLITLKREDLVKLLLAAAFAAALGGAIGVLVITCPPVRVILERFGLQGSMLRLTKNLGITFVILRAGPLIVLVAALLSGLFALIAWLLGGSRPLHVLIGVAALATVLAARWTAPTAELQERDAVRRALLAQLDSDLKADANVWAALSAAIVLRRDEGAAALRDRDPVRSEITNIILARRGNGETNDAILSVIEQRLGIQARETARPAKPEPDSEFIWKPEHEQYYDTFGAVELNKVVIVSRQPLFIEGADGQRQVTRKGLVAPKG
jgi:hypothetical protein